MNCKLLIAFFAACATATAARPSAAPAAAEAPVAAEPLNVGPYQLKNRSSFALAAETRTPLWPIGWVRPSGVLPPRSIVNTAGPGFQIQPHHFTVTSILLGGEPLATINGRAFGEGEMLPVFNGEKPVKVIVKAIRDGVVVLEQEGRQIAVPIQRKGIPQKGTDKLPEASEGFKIKINEK